MTANRVLVGNISYNATAVDLGKLFETIGPVTDASIAAIDGRSLGFGFVVLADENAAKTAVEKLNNTTLLDRRIRVELSRHSEEQVMVEDVEEEDLGEDEEEIFDENAPRSTTQIHVRNLARSTTVDELRQAFSGFQVKEVTIPQRFDGRALGFGLVDFQSPEEQQRALAQGELIIEDREVILTPAVIRPPRNEQQQN